MDAKGPSMDAKGPSMDAKGPSMNAKGPSIDAQGPSMDAKGSSMDAKGPSMDAKRPSIDAKGRIYRCEVPHRCEGLFYIQQSMERAHRCEKYNVNLERTAEAPLYCYPL